MIKTLIAADRSERDSFTIPRSVQESIPIKRVYRDGIWQVGRKHSRTWRLGDVNYQSASEEDQRAIFLAYCGVINSLPTDATAKITLFNRRLDPQLIRKTVLMKERGDRLDLYRRESNQILLDKMAQSNNLVQEKYITLSIPQRKIEDSRAYGINAVSKNPILCDRKRLISPHAFMLGVSGSGKSMGMKSTILNIALNTDDDIIIIDAEREYGPLAQALGGEVVEISPNSSHHINPLDLGDGSAYEGENPEAMKSELLMSILEQQMGTGALEGGLKSIIDRCTSNVLLPYLKNGGPAPLLTHWRQNVLQQPEEAAKDIALASEIIVEGTLNIFAHPTNVNMDSRIVVLDLYEMGEQLRPTGLVVTLDAIQNRVAQNRKKGKYTWVFVDEVYLFFKYHFSAQFLYKAWKRFRKYAAPMTAATQNVEECLRSETARLMFANSEFLVLYNQAATDQQELAKLLHISDTQLGYITNSPPGTGLLRMGGTLVPFLNTIPKDTELYRLMNTTPGEQ